jgi:hypothetical protein
MMYLVVTAHLHGGFYCQWSGASIEDLSGYFPLTLLCLSIRAAVHPLKMSPADAYTSVLWRLRTTMMDVDLGILWRSQHGGTSDNRCAYCNHHDYCIKEQESSM